MLMEAGMMTGMDRWLVELSIGDKEEPLTSRKSNHSQVRESPLVVDRTRVQVISISRLLSNMETTLK